MGTLLSLIIVILSIGSLIRLYRRTKKHLKVDHRRETIYSGIMAVLCLITTLCFFLEKDVFLTVLWGFNYYNYHRSYVRDKERWNESESV